jgi:putative intracellular protease/amidase
MADLAASGPLGALLRGAVARRLVVAAICHGPAALLSTRRAAPGAAADDDWPWRGVRMTGFTDEEEAGWLGDPARLPWTVQGALERAGAASPGRRLAIGRRVIKCRSQSQRAQRYIRI